MKELFYQDPYLKEFKARVIDCIPKGDKYWVELDNTALKVADSQLIRAF